MFIKTELLTDNDELKTYRNVSVNDIVEQVCVSTDLEFVGIGKRKCYVFETEKFITVDQIAFMSRGYWNNNDINTAIKLAKNILKRYCWSISVLELRQMYKGILIVACLNPWKLKNKNKKNKNKK